MRNKAIHDEQEQDEKHDKSGLFMKENYLKIEANNIERI